MNIFAFINLVFWYLVITCIMTVVGLMLLRLLVNYADINPFSGPALMVRRFSDPLVNPVRRRLASFGLDPKFAPLISILVAIVLGYFTLQVVEAVLGTLAGLLRSLQLGKPVAVVGYLLLGLLSVYSLLIIMRIIFSWGASQTNHLMILLRRATDPILVPFSRIIPPLGMFDISPIVVFIILRLLQEMVAATMLR